jgi:hypothetical protein
MTAVIRGPNGRSRRPTFANRGQPTAAGARLSTAATDLFWRFIAGRDPEVERLLKRVTGAERMLIFDHVVRNPVLAEREKRARASPPRSSTTTTASNRRHAASAIICPKKPIACSEIASPKSTFGARFAARSTGSPLALCDARSLSPEDIVPSDLVYRERVGETYGFLYKPKHRWYYFHRMEPNEAILLKCYDSNDDGRARFTAHTSFEDPNSSPNAAPRESIEVRALIFWPPETV